MQSRHIPLNPQRIEEGVQQDAERRSRERIDSGGGSHPLAGAVPVGDPKRSCDLCGKDPAKMDREFGWECSHVDCPCRRKCWSNGVGHHYRKPKKQPDPLGPLFDKTEV